MNFENRQLFTSTQFIKRCESVGKQCEFCKAIELWKHFTCESNCLADSQLEQTLSAKKFEQSLSMPLHMVLEPRLQHYQAPLPIEDMIQSLEELKGKISEVKEWKRQIQNLESNSTGQVRRRESQTLLQQNQLLVQENRLLSMEDQLNTQAALVFDLKERAAYISDTLQPSHLTALAVETQRLKLESQKLIKRLENLSSVSTFQKIELSKAKDEIGVQIKRHAVMRDAQRSEESLRRKSIGLNQELDRLERMQASLIRKIQTALEKIQPVSNNTSKLQEESKSQIPVSPVQLVEITNQVFSSYQRMKTNKDITLNYFSSQLVDLRNIPELSPHILRIKTEMSQIGQV